ncbi:MAG: 3-hydroxybutyrate oligomer hydrolase family protein [Burkholderiales bacterium]
MSRTLADQRPEHITQVCAAPLLRCGRLPARETIVYDRANDSQVVHTIPRDGTASPAPAITSANVPPIPQHPKAADRIRFRNNTVHVPD